MSIEMNEVKNIIEAALFAADQPLNVDKLLALFNEEESPARDDVKSVLDSLQQDYSVRGIELVEVSSGFRFQVKSEFGNSIARLWEEKPIRYSRALMETLALILYRQPITRAEIEDIRGVSVSSNIIRTLQDRDWIKVVGHKEVPGRPALFASTKTFLDDFGLKSLEELPPLSQIMNIDKINDELELHGIDNDGPDYLDAGLDNIDTIKNSIESNEIAIVSNPIDSTPDLDDTHTDLTPIDLTHDEQSLQDEQIVAVLDLNTEPPTLEIEEYNAHVQEVHDDEQNRDVLVFFDEKGEQINNIERFDSETSVDLQDQVIQSEDDLIVLSTDKCNDTVTEEVMEFFQHQGDRADETEESENSESKPLPSHVLHDHDLTSETIDEDNSASEAPAYIGFNSEEEKTEIEELEKIKSHFVDEGLPNFKNIPVELPEKENSQQAGPAENLSDQS